MSFSRRRRFAPASNRNQFGAIVPASAANFLALEPEPVLPAASAASVAPAASAQRPASAQPVVPLPRSAPVPGPASAPPAASATAPRDPVDATAFAALGLIPALVRAVSREGYDTPTPIQREAIPRVLEQRDLLGCAQTGTGKTAAFVLPMLQLLSGRDAQPRLRALVLTPTRELAAQIGERAGAYGCHLGIRHQVIYGGVNIGRQIHELRNRPQLVIATPGRLLDLMQQRVVSLDAVEILVLDEADRMLDMGFLPDMRRIIAAVPKVRQTLLFSATMPREIEGLAAGILRDPVRVSVTPAATTADTVAQSVYRVEKEDKRSFLCGLLGDQAIERALVFSRTKHGADRIAKHLVQAGIEAAAIHGNKSQNARERALDGFRRGSTRVLVATDIAARGIDVQGVSHVINFDLPNEPEAYVHRIGRTGRAGATGSAISFCDRDEVSLLRDIERVTKQRIPVLDASGCAVPLDAPPAYSEARTTPSDNPRGGSPRRGRGSFRRNYSPR